MKKFNQLLIIPFLLACGASQHTSSKPPKIVGNWQWMETSGGFAGITKTPESTNTIKHLQITADSIFYYENGELTNSQPYQLQLAKSMLSNKEEWQLNETISKVFISRQDSTLILREDCYDCFSQKYLKMNRK